MAVVNGTSAGDSLPGTDGPDLINGYGGNDIIFGGFGDDVMDGGDGDDIFYINSSAGTDYFYGGNGYDRIVVDNVLSSFSYVDVGIGGLTSVEEIVSYDSKPVYIVTSGSLDLTGVLLVDIDGFKGTADNDYMTAEAVYNSVSQTWSGMTMWGYDGNDEMVGSILNDTIYGGAGSDLIRAGHGSDVIMGGDGNDIILAGSGNDLITGGAGADFFWFEALEGVNTITDYQDGTDKFVVGQSLSSINLYNFDNGSTLIEFNGGTTYVILEGVAAWSIDSSDFLWA